MSSNHEIDAWKEPSLCRFGPKPHPPSASVQVQREQAAQKLEHLHAPNICGRLTQPPDVLSVLSAEGRQQAQPQVQQQAARQSQPADVRGQPSTAGHDRSLAAEHHHDPGHNMHVQTEGEDTFFDAEEGEPGTMLCSARPFMSTAVSAFAQHASTQAKYKRPTLEIAHKLGTSLGISSAHGILSR